MSRHPLIGASVVNVALTLFLTWPQGWYLGSKIANHDDSYFSAWRIAWIAHALHADPRHLYDANIFYPEPRTLAYSDATLLEGVIAFPFLWAGVSPLLMYNLLLLVGIAASGLGMFVLVRYLTNSTGAALVSSAAFTLVPYRIEHYMHLELQWTVWMPLALWAVHRATSEASWRFGALAGLFVALQLLSCLYYGIFLVIIMALLAVLLIASRPSRIIRQTAALAVGGCIAIVFAYLYSRPYVANARVLGERVLDQIVNYSAQPRSYLAAPRQNWLWGWTADRFRGNELRLFPGVVGVLLGTLAFASRARRVVWIYAAVCVVAIELSLGFNGRLYPWLYAHVWVLHGLRAPARWSIVAFCALAVMIGFGVEYLQTCSSSRRLREWVCAAALILIVVECGSAPMNLEDVPTQTPEVYQRLKSLGRGVMVELPMGRPPTMTPFDSTYAFWSTTHWNQLINGYSGYEPPAYNETLTRMLTFPDEASIARLWAFDVRYVLVHEHLYEPSEYIDLMLRMGNRPELVPRGRYQDWTGRAQLFELRPPAPAFGTRP